MIMDPQMRLFHECVWEALEDAGCVPATYDGLIGLYAGAHSSFYWELLTLISRTGTNLSEFAAAQLRDKDYLTTRISYQLNLKGPSITLQTACSTSLVAVDYACRSLLTGQSDMALAGGVSITLPQASGYLYQEGMIGSPDGHCRAFDAKAKGTLIGEGAGIVALKRLDDALRDNDNIYAVIKGFAANNDGNRKAGYTAPSIEGQVQVIMAAHQMADVDPETISYVEAHGTGTPLGDPVEIEALTLAFKTEKRGFCRIGSVKSNLGHLDTAAGIAGLIKTVLALKHRRIPPSLHFETPNPAIDFSETPFYVNTTLTPWQRGETPLRAGVSSFGIGGTNAHVVLEEAPPLQSSPGREYQLLVWSARSAAALDTASQRLALHFEKNPQLSLPDASYTLQLGRRTFPHRGMLVAAQAGEVAEELSSAESERLATSLIKGENPPVVFMFPGQGSQYVNMGRDLYRGESLFRREIDRCCDLLYPVLGYDIKEVLYPASDSSVDCEATEVAQPLIFMLEYALGRLLMEWGVRPHAMIGHSIGEYTAACLAGVFNLEDALSMVAARGRLMQQMPAGSMLGISMQEQEVKNLLKSGKDLALAAVNGRDRCVVSGPNKAIETLEKELKAKGHQCRRLHTSHAFHSPMMDPVLKPFAEEVARFHLQEPQIPCISNVSGDWLTAAQATDAGYWSTHLRGTVRFADGLERLLEEEKAVFVEVGPGSVLSTFLRKHPHRTSSHQVVNLVRHPKDIVSDLRWLLERIGRLWLYGVSIDWQKFYSGQQRRRVSMPTYPFERQRFWLEGNPYRIGAEMAAEKDRLKKKTDVSEWFYAPAWEQSLSPYPVPSDLDSRACWLIFSRGNPLDRRVITTLRHRQQEVVVVTAADSFLELEDDAYTVNPGSRQDYSRLIEKLKEIGRLPDHILHMWLLTGSDPEPPGFQRLEQMQERGFYSLLYLVQAIGQEGLAHDMHLEVVSDGLQGVTGEEILCPEKAALLGAVKIIPLEYPNIRCRSIDILLPPPQTAQEEQLVQELLLECMHGSSDIAVAFRGRHRWTQTMKPVRLHRPDSERPLLKENRVYLITGAFGGMGFTLARYLAGHYSARLVLVGRSGPTPENILAIQELEASGAEIMTAQADVSDLRQMREVIRAALQRFGDIDGVLHTAGVADYEGVIQRRTREQSEQVMAAKVKGTLVLDEIFRKSCEQGKKSPDFMVLFSSIGNITYGVKFGQVSYNAANEFLEAFASYKNGTGGSTHVTAVNWADWLEVGMSIAAIDKKFGRRDETPDYQSMLSGAITPGEGVEVFERIMGSRLHRVTVSTQELDAVVEMVNRVKEEAAAEEEPQTAAPSPLETTATAAPRPELSVNYVPPANQTEQMLAGIWQEFFGLAKVGVLDDFFELGGDSLKVMTVAAAIHKSLHVEIPLPVFFSGPTIRKLTNYIENAQENRFQAIEAVEDKEWYLLSPGQKRIFILEQIEERSTSYNQPRVLVIDGDFDAGRMEDVFRQLIRRHESLRTSFEIVDGEPVQKVLGWEQVEFEIAYYESRSKEPEQDQEIRSIIKDFIRPFPLSLAPLLRVGVIKLDRVKHILMLDMHHIISDGTSNSLFVKEFISLYNGESLVPLNLRYRDYSQWLSKASKQEEILKQEFYWLEEFRGETPLLTLPGDFPRPAVQSFEGNSLAFSLAKNETEGLKRLARDTDCTLFMVLLSIYTILLSRLSSQEDIIVGTPIAGRRHAQLEQVMGVFINTLALRSRPGGEKTVRQFLSEVREKTLKAFENQDYPFEDIIDKVSVDRDMSRNPLFDVMFIMQNMDLTFEKLEGLRIRPFHHKNNSAKFDLTLQVETAGDILIFVFEYCTALFKERTIQAYISYFKQIVARATGDPGVKISEIEIMTEADRQQVLEEFNSTAIKYPAHKTLQCVIEEQALRIPDQIVLIDGHYDSLTYRELVERICRLAFLLKKKGVGPGTIAALMPDRSILMMVGLLAILKTGAAYLPIDPHFPEARIIYMLKDSRTRMLVSGVDGVNELAGEMEIEVVDLHRVIHDPYPTGMENENSKQNPVNSGNPAYVIYTSGSTGKPKGVAIHHRNLLNFIKGITDEIAFTPRDTILSLTTISFDIFGLETFLPLTVGSRVLIGSEEEQVNARAAADTIEREQVSIIQFTPSRLQLFTSDKEASSALNRLNYLLVGGEAFPETLLQKARSLTKAKIVNLYGPTETTIWSTLADLTGDVPLTIGKPIANTRIYILSKGGLPQPVGVYGELCIGGDGVGPGYLNKPELTAEKFIVFNRSNKSYSPEEKLYHTGDLARWRPDGTIEFMGRSDYQVKIRGFRIELGEIEHRLQNHEQIVEAVVSVKEEKEDKYLCAYIVSADNQDLSVSALRRYLLEELPDYMVPTHFVTLEKIPLTPNGKIDRKALDSYDVNLSVRDEYIAPASNLEQAIASIWAGLLQVEKVGINHNFFDLGGNSMKLIRVNNRIKEELGIDVPVLAMFRYATISALVRFIHQDGKEEAAAQFNEKEEIAAIDKGKRKLMGLKKQMNRQ
jgi:amino acid adenylation domain-containing protein